MSPKIDLSEIGSESIKEDLESYLDDQISAINGRIESRIDKLETEDPDYYKVLKLFGLSPSEAAQMDKYHNIGRFVFRNLGTIMEDLTLACLKSQWNGQCNAGIKNTISPSPDKFGIDWLNEDKRVGYEIKWRYATTDGTTVKKIKNMATQLDRKGYTPIFLTYYQSKRKQPLRCYNQIADHFESLGGQVYSKDEAWEHINEFTGFDLFEFINSYSPPKSPT